MSRPGLFIATVATLSSAGTTPAVAQAPANQAQESTLTLSLAVERALAIDPRRDAAVAQADAAEAAVRAAGSERWPSVSAEGTATRFQEAMIVAPLHRFDPMAPPRFARTLVQSRWIARYTLFDGGARGAAIRLATASSRASTANTHAVEMNVVESVTNAYLTVVAVRELRRAEERRTASLESERARVQQLLEVGRTPRVSLLRADAALASARASTVATQQQLDAARSELARLLAIPQDSIARLELPSVRAVSSDSLDAHEIVARAIGANPQIVAARQEVDMQRAAERSARASWFPTVQLAAGVVTYAGSGVDVTAEWQGGVTVSYPLFLGGARLHRVAGAAAAREAAEAALAALERDVAIAADNLISRVRESRARLEALTAAVTYADEVVRIERLALASGAGVQADFLRAEADLFTARADQVAATHAELRALIALAIMTGDLSLSWLQDTVENR